MPEPAGYNDMNVAATKFENGCKEAAFDAWCSWLGSQTPPEAAISDAASLGGATNEARSPNNGFGFYANFPRILSNNKFPDDLRRSSRIQFTAIFRGFCPATCVSPEINEAKMFALANTNGLSAEFGRIRRIRRIKSQRLLGSDDE